MTEPLLEARNLSVGYGKLPVLHDLDLRVGVGEVVALVGANGAGKTTTLLALAGELQPHAGEVRMFGRVTRAPMHVRCRKDLAFVTEERSVIMGMSVADNLRLAGVRADVAVEQFPALRAVLRRSAGLCSGGEQQMLALASALGRDPKVLLIDELSLGLAPIIVQDLLRTVRRVADERGVGVVLVEQHVRQALTIADHVHLMERGRSTLQGTAAAMAKELGRIEAGYLAGVEWSDGERPSGAQEMSDS